MTTLRLRLAAINEELKKTLRHGSSSKLWVFWSADSANKSQRLITIPWDSRDDFDCQLSPPSDIGTHLCFWWYAEDLDPCCPKGSALVLQGVGFLRAQSADNAEVKLRPIAPLHGKRLPNMATLQVVRLTLDVPLPPPTVPAIDLAPFDKYSAAVSRQLFPSEGQQNAVTLDRLQRWPDSKIYLPVPDKHQHPVPAWVFTLSAWDDRNRVSNSSSDTIARYLEVCKARLLHNTRKDWTEAEHMELACEAASYLPLMLPYRKDRVIAEETEQYTNVAHSPAMLKAAVDCEDATETALRVLYRMQHDPSCSAKVDPSLHALLQEYEFMFCVVTLEVDGDRFYHGAVMGFDKEWLRGKVDGGGWLSRNPPPKHRCVLIESTDFLTSHYGLQEEKDVQNYLLNPMTTSDCWHTRIPSRLLVSAAQYHHLVSAYTPQWIESKQIGEIAFYYHEGLGVPLTELLDNDKDVIKNLVVRSPKAPVTSELLQLARKVLSYSPCYAALPSVSSNPDKPVETLRRGSTSFTRDLDLWEEWKRVLKERHISFHASWESVHKHVPLYFITVTRD